MNTNRLFIAAVITTTGLWCCSSAVVGCTPKREAATVNQITRKSKCALQDLNRTPEQMLLDCAIPKDAQDVQDIIDIFTGAQAAAVNTGAQLPKAQPGMRPRDGGSK